MSDVTTFEIIKTIGFAVIEAGHRRFEFDGIDNEEYISSLKTSIDAIASSSAAFVDKAFQKELALALRTHALDLFVDLWLRLGDQVDDDQGPAIEKKRAIKLFNQIYDKT